MRIKTKVCLVFLLFLTLLVLLGWIFISTTWKRTALEEKLEISEDLVEKVFGLNLLINDYLLFQGERSRQQWLTVHESLGNTIDHKSTGDNSVTHYHSAEENTLLDRLKEDQAEIGNLFENLQNPDLSEELRGRLVSRILIKSQEMFAQVFELSQISRRSIVETEKRGNRFSSIIMSLMLVLIPGGFIVIVFSTLKPLKEMKRGLEIIGTGNLDYKIGIVRNDEVGELSGAVNRMTEQLKSTIISRDDLNLEILERKRAEEDLRRLKEELEITVEERTALLQQKVLKLDRNQKAMLYMVEDLNGITAELKDNRKRLEAVNAELESFSYSVSHDLRAPLRAIDGFSQIIEEEYAGVLDDEGLRLLSVVRTNTKKMDELISDLLELSRTGRTEMRLTQVDMTDTAGTVYNEIASPEIRKKFDFRLSSLPSAEADYQFIRRVWSNLISNAIKYTLPAEKRIIEVTGYDDSGFHIYSVRDTGVGFNQKYLGKLFKLFQRLHKADEFEGTGVGLAIVQRIISRHGGSVWAEGKEGVGAVFCFSLPKK